MYKTKLEKIVDLKFKKEFSKTIKEHVNNISSIRLGIKENNFSLKIGINKRYAYTLNFNLYFKDENILVVKQQDGEYMLSIELFELINTHLIKKLDDHFNFDYIFYKKSSCQEFVTGTLKKCILKNGFKDCENTPDAFFETKMPEELSNSIMKNSFMISKHKLDQKFIQLENIISFIKKEDFLKHNADYLIGISEYNTVKNETTFECIFFFNGKKLIFNLKADHTSDVVLFSLKSLNNKILIDDLKLEDFKEAFTSYWEKKHLKERIHRLLNPPRAHFNKIFGLLVKASEKDKVYDELTKEIDKIELEDLCANNHLQPKITQIRSSKRSSSFDVFSFKLGKYYISLFLMSSKLVQLIVEEREDIFRNKLEKFYQEHQKEEIDYLMSKIK